MLRKVLVKHHGDKSKNWNPLAYGWLSTGEFYLDYIEQELSNTINKEVLLAIWEFRKAHGNQCLKEIAAFLEGKCTLTIDLNMVIECSDKDIEYHYDKIAEGMKPISFCLWYSDGDSVVPHPRLI